MNPEEIAARALADLEAETQTALEHLHARAEAAKARIEGRASELQAQAGTPDSVEPSDGVWELDSGSETVAAEPEAAPMPDFGADLIAPVAGDFTTDTWKPD
ncbi:MAG: hypothetical protein JO101_09285 [Candidatus Eremiobacteraeota bacterium]|nr:hypothetical protein [Candidatus Eremiobacteraeota bacterium]